MENCTIEKTKNAFLDQEVLNKHRSIHLPVSPVCNIKCRFCKMSFDKYEINAHKRGAVLKPEEALSLLDEALKLYPDITMAVIAGPGDTLATSHALDAFELIHKKYPDLTKCLGTNGLMLKENAQRIVNAGIKTVTVNVNAVYPEIVQNICSHIIYNGSRLTDKEAALWLLLAQLSGIKKVSELGVVVKINTVLIPGVNDDHIDEIARITAGVGASLLNIIPLKNETEETSDAGSSKFYKSLAKAEKFLSVRHLKRDNDEICGIPEKNDIVDLEYDGLNAKICNTVFL